MMKTYKKSTLLLGLAMLSGGTIAAETKEEILQKLMAAHANLFYRTKLADPVEDWTYETSSRQNWFEALKELHGYVVANAKENAKLLMIADKVRRVGEGIADGIKDNTYVSRLEGAKEILKNTTFLIDRQQRNNAKKVLLEVIDLLESTMKMR